MVLVDPIEAQIRPCIYIMITSALLPVLATRLRLGVKIWTFVIRVGVRVTRASGVCQ